MIDFRSFAIGMPETSGESQLNGKAQNLPISARIGF
jgi:hypothetical protein